MTEPAPKPATYADIEALPPGMVGEIIDGTLVTHPRPVPRHATASSSLGMALGPRFQFGDGGPGGWIIVDEPELHLGPHVMVPDLAAWRLDRFPAKEADQSYFTTPPDWICEILSPSTERYDRNEKRRIYATYKVPFLWLIDPRVRILEAFERQDQNWVLIDTVQDAEEVAVRPFDAAPFSLGLLWPFDQLTPSAADNKTD
jgi:Uma2 family endonuclease